MCECNYNENLDGVYDDCFYNEDLFSDYEWEDVQDLIENIGDRD